MFSILSENLSIDAIKTCIIVVKQYPDDLYSLYASFYKYTIRSKTFLVLDVKMQLFKGRVLKRDPGCVVNCEVSCKICHASVPCCPVLGMFGTAKSGIRCIQAVNSCSETA